MPASGKAQTASPSSRSERTRRYAAAGAWRSTGTCRIASMPRRTTGTFQMSWRHRKRTCRPRCSPAFPMNRKSG